MSIGLERQCLLLAVLLVAEIHCVMNTVPLNSWTTLTPIPSHPFVGTAAIIGSKMFVVDEGTNHVFDIDTGMWTSAVTSPTICTKRNSGIVHSKLLVVGGNLATSPTCFTSVESFDASLGQWTTKASAPTSSHRKGGTADDAGLYFYAMGSVMQVYDGTSDAWTLRQAPPVTINGGGMAFGVGKVVAFGNTNQDLQIYTPLTDTWTTGVPAPRTHGSLIDDNLSCVANTCFLVGGDSSTDSDFDKYNIDTGAWTILSPSPYGMYTSGTHIFPNGILVAAGSYSALTRTFAFNTGVSTLSLVFDPVLTTFDGHAFHRYLHAGVFNFLTTASLVVNVLVDTLHTLPPEENNVVTMVGVVAALSSGHTVLVDCSQQSRGFVCTVGTTSSLDADLDQLWTQTGNTFSVSLPNYTVNVRGQAASLITEAIAYPPSNYFDIDVVRVNASADEPVFGLIAGSETSLIASGCLYDVAAVASVFDHASTAALC